MSEAVRIEGEHATLVIDDEEIPADATLTWSAAHVAALVRMGYVTGHESGQSLVLDTIKAHPELVGQAGAQSFKPSADANITLTQTTFVRDADGKLTGAIERVVTPPPPLPPPPRRRSTDHAR